MLVIDKIERIALIILKRQGYNPSGEVEIDWENSPHPRIANAFKAACDIWEEIFGDSPDLYADFDEDFDL